MRVWVAVVPAQLITISEPILFSRDAEPPFNRPTADPASVGVLVIWQERNVLVDGHNRLHGLRETQYSV
jgi:hypothetical protein